MQSGKFCPHTRSGQFAIKKEKQTCYNSFGGETIAVSPRKNVKRESSFFQDKKEWRIL